MSELPAPIREALAPALRPGDARRLWRGIAARRAARAPSVPVWRAALMGAALAAALLLLIEIRPWRAPERPLALADGRDLAALEIPPSAADETALSDGSRVSRAPGARLRVLESTATVVDMLLVAGRARFHVQKGGPRRWVVECGLLSAEVVGTDFVVDRDDERARVEVNEGIVLVRGERVPDRVKRLGAGESIEVRAQSPVTLAEPPKSAPLPDSTSEPPAPTLPPRAASDPGVATAASAGSGVPAASTAAAPESWQELARTAAYDRAYETLGKAGIARTAAGASVDVLLELADVARLSGHPEEAITPLTAIADQHAGDPRAPLAAFTLGSVLLARAPALAAARFEQAIAGGLPVSLVEDALAHIVEARARAGDPSGAAAAAARYERAYPNGRQREAVRRWVDRAGGR